MREAGSEFIQEEARPRGARPRLQAVIYPFDLDYGLAPDSGEYVHTAYGGEPGKLVLEGGYHPSGSWTSPVMHTYSPHLNRAVPCWEEQEGNMQPRVFLRVAGTPGEISQAAYSPLGRGEEVELRPFFQIKVEFQQDFRSWSVDLPEEADEFAAYAISQPPDGGYESYVADGAGPGSVSRLRLEGRLSLPESEILDAGRVRVELARDFGELRDGNHTLVMDNRRGQWLLGGEDFYLKGLDWQEKHLALYHGWELPHGKVERQLVYQGALTRISGITHGWQEKHRACLESRNWVAARLSRRLGAPSASGEKRPFMRGAYLARGELTAVTPAAVSTPVKTGSGSAVLRVAGIYRGDRDQSCLVETESTGEVGAARFRWSVNNGQSWKQTDCLTSGPENPVELEEGLAVYWDSGAGTDLADGDRWTFTAAAAIYQYLLAGAPFEAVTAVYLNGEETWDRVAADAAQGLVTLTGRSAGVEARVVKAGVSHPVDIIYDILTEMGLEEAVHQDSFALAKSLTPDYAIGVGFENVTGTQALREIVRRCLYDLWVDFGEIKLRAYLGD